MNQLYPTFSAYVQAEGAEKNTLMQSLLEEDCIAFFISELSDGDIRYCRAALMLLATLSKKEQNRQDIQALLPAGALESLLDCEDAKVRKNTAILMGKLADDAYVGALCRALAQETQQFVVPSILLALGAVGGEAAKTALLAYPLSQGEDVHAIAQRDAYQKAYSKLFPHNPAVFTGFSKAHHVLLAPVSGLMDSLLTEGREKGFPLKKMGGYAAILTADYPALFRMRCFYEALLPFGSVDQLTPETLSSAVIGNQLYSRLKEMHRIDGAFPMRLEIRNAQVDRGKFASEFFQRLSAKEFYNAPSSYDIELRAVQKKKKALLFIRLHTFSDPRYAYRLGTVPASIHPAAAAAAMYLLPHRRKKAAILDPFCGSGTMLIERDFFEKTSKLNGVDISQKAVQLSEANAQAIGLDLKCFHRSIVGFVPKEPFDEVISNMPFGNRVGTHDSNLPLYREFFKQLPHYLKPGGIALLITNEKALLLRSARSVSELEFLKEVPFSYGGLSPSAFLFRRKES